MKKFNYTEMLMSQKQEFLEVSQKLSFLELDQELGIIPLTDEEQKSDTKIVST